MKFCVIGVGRFGYHVARTLADNGMEVMAVDSNESIVASIRDHVSQAVCMRISDEDNLKAIGIDEFDTVIVAMGENFAQSILVTALLKQKMQIPTVIARAITTIHKEILKLVGADQIVLPEQEMGVRLADTLSHPFMTLLRLSSNFSISQKKAPLKFVGKTLGQLKLQETYEIHCIGKKINEEIQPLFADAMINKDDMLVFAGTNDNLERLEKLS